MTISKSIINTNECIGQDKTLRSNRKPLTPEFWDYFSKHFWEKEEFVVNEKSLTPPISERALFDIIVGMCERKFEELKGSVGVGNSARVYIGKNRKPFQNIEDSHLFPKRMDKTFSEYSNRVESSINGQEFALVIDNLTLSDELRDWTCELLKGMHRPLNKLSYGHYWSIFFGNYTTTTYGVHDHSTPTIRESAFYLPISGNKKMRTWRPEYIERNPELKENHDYSNHTDASVLLSADPGGMMYWPSDRWHIGSSSGGDVSIVLAIAAMRDVLDTFVELLPYLACFFRSRSFDLLALIGRDLYYRDWFIDRFVKDTGRHVDSIPFDPDDLQSSAMLIPPELRKVVKPFAFIFGKNLERALSFFWLSQLSTFGYDEGEFPPSGVGPFPDTRVRRNVEIRMLWRQVDDVNHILVSGKLHMEIPSWFLPMAEYVEALSYGEELVYTDMICHLPDHEPTELKNVLDEFVSFLNKSRFIISVELENI